MSPETLASAALFFGGRPVLGSHGIESGFAGSAVGQFLPSRLAFWQAQRPSRDDVVKTLRFNGHDEGG